jgi:hypothetical protein
MQERPPPRHLRLEQTPLERGRLWIEIAAFIAAGCWAVYTFVYQTKIAPLFQPPHEVVSVSAQRLATTPSNYLERVEVSMHNDGNVDVDTAAIALSVYGTKAQGALALHSSSAPAESVSREIPVSAWTPVGGYGLLLDGSVEGHRGQHFILRPGDSVPFQQLIVVPRAYDALLVELQTIFDRYPISPRIAVRLVEKNGAITLKSKGVSIDLETYFGV